MNAQTIKAARALRMPAMRVNLAGVLSVFVASVWLVHGLYNKLLHGSPRHLAIVQSVPGLGGHAGELVLVCVGIGEVLLSVWMVSGIRIWACVIVQAVALLSMNVLELAFAADHLLWPAGLVPINLAFLGIAAYAAHLRDPAVLNRLRLALRRHPIPMSAHFKHCLVLTFAYPADTLQRLLPRGLDVDRYCDWGFVAVAMVQTESMRPSALPKWCGQDFFLSGYRIFVKHHDRRTRRGLRILRSDTNKRRMVLAGNLMTHYNYRHGIAHLDARDGTLEIRFKSCDGSADLHVLADLREAGDAALPAGSVFKSARDARRFAGPLPWTFDAEIETNSIVGIKGVRAEWKPKLVPVEIRSASWFTAGPLKHASPILCSAFYVNDIDYCWERGIVMSLEREAT